MLSPSSTADQDRFEVKPQQERQFAPHLEHVFWPADDPARQELPAIRIGKAHTECSLLQTMTDFVNEIESIDEREPVAFQARLAQLVHCIELQVIASDF